MPRSPSWAVVVPSNRTDRLREFIQAWREPFAEARAHLIVVWDGPDPPATVGTVLAWGDIPEFIPRRTDMIRSAGIWEAWRRGYEFTASLDDDVLPTTDLFGEYEKAFNTPLPLSSHLDVGGLTSSGQRMRGFPYRARHCEVAIQYGGWAGTLDLDAATQLTTPTLDETFAPVVLPVPAGVPVTTCAMNMAWRRDMAPLMWQLPLHEGRYARMGDIWAGLIQKRVLDALGLVMVVNGRALVRHDRASDPFVNLEREAPGMGLNENMWLALTNPQAGSVSGAFRQVTDSLARYVSETNPKYAEHFTWARDQWLALF